MAEKSTARSDIASDYFVKLHELWDQTDLKFNPTNKKDAMSRAKRMLSHFARNILGISTKQFSLIESEENTANSSGQVILRTDVLQNGEKGVYICIEQIVSGVNYSLSWGTVNHRKDVVSDLQRSKVSNCFRNDQEILRFAAIVKNKCKVKKGE